MARRRTYAKETRGAILTHMPRSKSPPASQLPNDLVHHPRYGAKVGALSGERVSEADIRASHWSFRDPKVTMFPESVLVADIARQNFSTMAMPYYVDTLETCRDCARPFLFFARERKHWYEVLGFFIDARCVRCSACRKSDHTVRRRFRRYGETTALGALSAIAVAALATLAEDAVFLWEAGVLRDETRLRAIRNAARRRIPAHRATKRIDKVVTALP